MDVDQYTQTSQQFSFLPCVSQFKALFPKKVPFPASMPLLAPFPFKSDLES